MECQLKTSASQVKSKNNHTVVSVFNDMLSRLHIPPLTQRIEVVCTLLCMAEIMSAKQMQAVDIGLSENTL